MLLYIFILFTGWLVIKAIIRVVSQYKHLTIEETREVAYNTIDRRNKSYSRIIRHLGICEDCQNRLINFKEEDHLEDHLIDREEED